MPIRIEPRSASPCFKIYPGDDPEVRWFVTVFEDIVIDGVGIFPPFRLPDGTTAYAGRGGEWSERDGVHVYRGNIDDDALPLHYTIAVEVDQDSSVIDIGLWLKNMGHNKIDEQATSISCFQQYRIPHLHDPDGARTFVVKGGKIRRVSDEAKPMETPAPFSGQFGFARSDLDAALIMRQGTDGRTVGYGYQHLSQITGNMLQSNCIHANPSIGPVEPGGVFTNRGRIYLAEKSPEALLERFSSDFAPGTTSRLLAPLY